MEKRKIRVIAANNYKKGGFDIYLDFSGRREYLMRHRHNGVIYNMIGNGVRLEDLKRKTGREKRALKYLLEVIDEYLEEEAA